MDVAHQTQSSDLSTPRPRPVSPASSVSDSQDSDSEAWSPMILVPPPSPASPCRSSLNPSLKSCVKIRRNLQASLLRIKKFRQKKGLSIQCKIRPGKPKVQSKGANKPRKDLYLPGQPRPPKELPETPPQGHPFEIFIANALLGLHDPLLYAGVTQSSTQEDHLETSDSLVKTPQFDKEPESLDRNAILEPKEASESWASLSKNHLVPSLVDMFGGEPDIEIPGICVSKIPEAGAPGGSVDVETSDSKYDSDCEAITSTDNL